MYFILIVILALVFPLVAAFFMSRFVFDRAVKAGLKSPRAYQAISFFFSFIVILGSIIVLAAYNIRIER